ncbi:hypothetical protein M2164_008494 [Streptomyces sp. SAI-208]|uniref:hypothetical protein n=1 Tax=unclassified Streptomyces TaxID=2593676 RepID=UPI0024759B59|nr:MULTISPECIES: hypothetical protein [unclassified Streptomyces]MDH6581841.1 hypothetical protein [Streptomyces sp. SAI-133]MDH6612859.1 hypothetical protein [Streptomyces sp. SAI-208]
MRVVVGVHDLLEQPQSFGEAGSSGAGGLTPTEMTDQIVFFFVSGITSVASRLPR